MEYVAVTEHAIATVSAVIIMEYAIATKHVAIMEYAITTAQMVKY